MIRSSPYIIHLIQWW